MDRREFVNTALRAGLCCCGAASALHARGMGDKGKFGTPEQTPDWIRKMEQRMIKGAESADWLKYEKSAAWIKDLMDNMDSLLDLETRRRLMQANGRACYLRAFGVASDEKPTAEYAQGFIDSIKKDGNEVKEEGGKTIVIFNWGRKHQNPQGLILQDGYCMCPIVESGPPRLSPTFCQCSAGYVKEIFARYTGRTVEKVEVLDSLKMGGRDCVFRVELLSG